ncbi:Glycoside Hydrolase Family 24 protein [Gigaspora rosea]|uniref:Glycoside Hydrolase Family 24 protein n=1 Tax=Gigaspora rosea TaxID=44941 RepID=A0A397U2F2_9GLOM|nr:Glycoside Hydrolase Family 24 protein [Gigaspora rosea]
MIVDTNAYKINNDGLKFIKEQEGFEPNFYTDSAGKKTIGYGHNCDANADPQKCKQIRAPISREQGEVILKRDLVEKEACVTELTKIKINPDQFSALVSFAYNLGCPYYKSTSLLKKLNSGDIKGAANEFRLYNKSGGKITNGLVKRREAERVLFCKNGGC